MYRGERKRNQSQQNFYMIFKVQPSKLLSFRHKNKVNKQGRSFSSDIISTLSFVFLFIVFQKKWLLFSRENVNTK